MPSISRSVLCLFVVGLVSYGMGQGNPPPSVTLTAAKPTVRASGTFEARLTLHFADGLHAYQNPPTDPAFIPLSVKSGDKVFRLVTVRYPKGTLVKMEGEDKPIAVYQGTLTIPVVLRAPSKAGSATLTLDVNYQQCNATACFPQATVRAKATIKVVRAVHAQWVRHAGSG